MESFSDLGNKDIATFSLLMSFIKSMIRYMTNRHHHFNKKMITLLARTMIMKQRTDVPKDESTGNDIRYLETDSNIFEILYF